MSSILELIESISKDELENCQENISDSFENGSLNSRMNMIAFD